MWIVDAVIDEQLQTSPKVNQVLCLSAYTTFYDLFHAGYSEQQIILVIEYWQSNC